MSASASAPTPEHHRLPRRRRYLVRGLLALAAVFAVAAIAAVWANRQALNADNWATTSSAMLENPEIRSQLSAYVVDEVYRDVDVAAELSSTLPPRLQPLAGPAAGALRNVAVQTTDTMLGRPRVQRLWEATTRVTAQQFINVAEGKQGAITSSGNAVILNLRPLVLELVARLGLPPSIAQKIPRDAGRITVMSGNQVSSLTDLTSALRGFAVVLPALAIALLALAVYLARHRRRETLLEAGCVLIAAGILVLLARKFAGPQVVDSLVSTDAAKPAAQAAWSIGTQILRNVAQATVIIGIPLVVGAWIAGPQRIPVALRRRAAPALRLHPGMAYAILGLLLVLVVAWGPIPATRSPVPVLLMVVLAAAGLAALRRQIAAEFPEPVPGVPLAVPTTPTDGAARTVEAEPPAVVPGGTPR